MSIIYPVAKFGMDKALNYAMKDPRHNLSKIMEWVDKFAGGENGVYPGQRKAFREVVNDPNRSMNQLIMRVFENTDSHVLHTVFENFIMNANLIGWKRQEELRAKLGCNIPWAILLDPTSACNLHCTGCWAAEYGNKLNLSFDTIDSIVEQGKELGVYFYIYTGGEPLVRKKDIIELCRKHDDCMFLSFTNGTLIDEQFAQDMLEVGNFMPAISVEGFEEATDSRRGKGTFAQVVAAMNLLKEKKLPFGISCCYTSANIDSVSSDAYVEQMIEWGAVFVWYFHYMPVGMNASPELLPTPEQREAMYHKIRDIRANKAIFGMDFQNDGQFVGGCIAGGRRYLHINAKGDVDPCVFVHFSDSNIHDKTLLEALQSPLFMAYHDGQPFNDNMLRPCPMLENPDKLRAIIESCDAPSTDPEAPETAEHLCAKCDSYAQNWLETSERLWELDSHVVQS